jgi:plastocyanin
VEPAFQPVQSWKFEPASVTVKVSEKITWLNTGAVAHTVTADDGKTFDSGNMAAQAEFSFTPTRAGTYTYHCAYHPWMKGTITVVP